MSGYELIVESDKIRSVSDLPTDDTQTDPLRRLVNHWRQLANSMSARLCNLMFAFE